MALTHATDRSYRYLWLLRYWFAASFGGTISLSRLAYGIVPLNIAIGVLLSRHPRQGYLILGAFMTLLAKIAVGFAQERWVG